MSGGIPAGGLSKYESANWEKIERAKETKIGECNLPKVEAAEQAAIESDEASSTSRCRPFARFN